MWRWNDQNCNGIDILCPYQPIPTLTEWGILLLIAVVLVKFYSHKLPVGCVNCILRNESKITSPFPSFLRRHIGVNLRNDLPLFVIPTKVGIQEFCYCQWIPVYTGMTEKNMGILFLAYSLKLKSLKNEKNTHLEMNYTSETFAKNRLKLDSYAKYWTSYKFFNEAFTVKSDSKDILENCDRIYEHFIIKTDPDLPVCYVISSKEILGSPFVSFNNEVYQADDFDMLSVLAPQKIFNAIAEKLKTHFLIHGASLSLRGNGLCFTGESCFGKTTLALELVRRGFKCLSDEYIAFNKETLNTDPFPQHFRVREKSFEVVGLKHRSDHLNIIKGIDSAGKFVVDINRLRHNSWGSSCKGKYIFLLTSENKKKSYDKILCIRVKKINNSMLDELIKIDGVEKISITKKKRETSFVIKLNARKEAYIATLVENICNKNKIEMFGATWDTFSPPDFTKSPRLEEVSHSIMLKELIKRMYNGPNASLYGEFEGSLPKTILKLGEIIKDVKCYRLFSGKLDETVELIYHVIP